jgi:hypothetical protein
MNKTWSAVLEVFCLFMCCVLLVSLAGGLSEKDYTLSFDADFHAPGPRRVVPGRGGSADPGPGKTIERRFRWQDHKKQERETVFHLPGDALKKEIRRFGTARPMDNRLFLEKRGFKVIGARTYARENTIYERLISVIDYKQIFQRNLPYFKALTGELIASAQLPGGEDLLYPFLAFVQHIFYKLPPSRYRGKFINRFFVPLVLLYEQYGDCDSKSLLLAEFLCAGPGPGEKPAMVLIRARGLSHALLAVKRKPLPGMTVLHFLKKGYYVVLETTSPGWAPGFINPRLTDVLKEGRFLFVELN